MGDWHDEGSCPWRSGHPLRDVLGVGLLATENDDENAEKCGEFYDWLKK
jgi:hypothetical protein